MNKRKTIFANKMHRELFSLVFFASFVPTLITVISLYYLIFYITTDQVGIPEAIAYNIIPAAQKVIVVLSIAMPIAIIIMLISI